MTNLIGDIARSIGLPAAKRAAGVVTRVLPIPQPTLMVGAGSSARLGQTVADFGHRKILLVTDGIVAKLGLAQPLIDALAAAGAAYVVFDEITPDAPIPLVEKGIELFKREQCDAIIAFGGGSVMDAAKVIGLAAANGKHPRQLVGYFRGLHGPVPIYAVPTTAGTGSEVTVAAVISDPEREKKLVIADTRIVPKMAALDPLLMTGLPPAITAATGMDALTHAVEAYIGYWGTAYTDRMALSAVTMIYEYLPRAYGNGNDLQAREKMVLASTYAGFAFTRANVGNVHAIAHQLGGKYHTPHGLANAIVLPHVLRFSAAETTGKLAELAVRAKVGEQTETKGRLAEKFLDSIDVLEASLEIPRQLDALREADIPALAAAACWEADTNYPVPRRMTQGDCEAILRRLLPKRAEPKAAAAAPKANRARTKRTEHAAVAAKDSTRRPRRRSAAAKPEPG